MDGIPRPTVEALVRQLAPLFACVIAAMFAFTLATRDKKNNTASVTDPKISKHLAIWVLCMVGISAAFVPIAITLRAFSWKALAYDSTVLLTVTIAQSTLTAVAGFFLPKLLERP
jgi:hypothetical protein